MEAEDTTFDRGEGNRQARGEEAARTPSAEAEGIGHAHAPRNSASCARSKFRTTMYRGRKRSTRCARKGFVGPTTARFQTSTGAR